MLHSSPGGGGGGGGGGGVACVSASGYIAMIPTCKMIIRAGTIYRDIK